MVEHQLSDTKPATLFEQLCHWTVLPSSGYKPGSLVLDYLERIQEVVFSPTPETDLEDKFALKYSILNHDHESQWWCGDAALMT